MIRKGSALTTDFREHMRGGEGTVEITGFVNAEELNQKGRLFGRIVLHPGCGIGAHTHEGESELFYIYEGQAIYNDNGTETPVSAGDVTLCASGESHGIRNASTADCCLVALIVHA